MNDFIWWVGFCVTFVVATDCVILLILWSAIKLQSIRDKYLYPDKMTTGLEAYEVIDAINEVRHKKGLAPFFPAFRYKRPKDESEVVIE